MTPIAALIFSENVKLFLKLITFCEGTDLKGKPYTTLFGHGQFTDTSKHPNILVKQNGYSSTAAGRYQINFPTYKELGMSGFSPAEQDHAAIQLIKKCGAYQGVLNADWTNAIKKCNKRWASLPGSPYGQPTKSIQACLGFLKTEKKKHLTGSGL